MNTNEQGKLVLSGMRPTGNLHIGNYFGAIKQFLELQKNGDRCYFFAADLHALTEVTEKMKLAEASAEVVKNYMACGIDPNQSVLYRQSDIPEIAQIGNLLGNVVTIAEMQRCTTFKGKREDVLVKRLANARGTKFEDAKKLVAENGVDAFFESEEIQQVGAGFSYGLLGYPVLMAADILCVRADIVPVGNDQVQHVEMARDMARTFNRMFDTNVLTIPELNETNPPRIPGIDGRDKMGKSDGNTIALLEPMDSIRKKIMGIPTQSETGGEMEPGTNVLFFLMELISPPDVHTHYLRSFSEGTIKFGEMKKRLAEDIQQLLLPIQEVYHHIHDDDVQEVLAQGAQTVRPIAQEVLSGMKDAMGL